MRTPQDIMGDALKRFPDVPNTIPGERSLKIVGQILEELAIETCVPEADAYKLHESTTRSQAMCFGEGVKLGFFAGWLARHYFANDFRPIDRDVFDAVKLRFPLLAERIDAMLNAWGGDEPSEEGTDDEDR